MKSFSDDGSTNDAVGGSDEVLVAYLDGQLSAEECEKIEAQLARDATTRQRLQALDRVWNALDVLPRSTASPSFTRSTVEMAAVNTSQQGAGGRPKTGRRWPLLLATVSLVGLLAGAVFSLGVSGYPERRAARDLPTALHAAALEQVGSLANLKQLADHAAKDLKPFRSDVTRTAAAEWAEVAAMAPAQRHTWAAGLSAANLATVNASVAEFQARPAEKQESLRRFEDELVADPAADELREVALAYETMVRRLPATAQSSLRQTGIEERLRLIDREAHRWARDARLDLSAGERAAFRDSVDRLIHSAGYRASADAIVQSIHSAFTKRAGEAMADRVTKPMGEWLRREPSLLLYSTTASIAGRGDRRGPLERWFTDMGRSPGGEALKQTVRAAWRGWVEELQSDLPETAREELAGAEDDDDRARLLSHLLRQTAIEEDLPSAFARLNPNEMQDVLLLSNDEFIDSLNGRAYGGEELPPFPPDPREGGPSSREGRPRFDGGPGAFSPRGGNGGERRRGPPFGFGPPNGEGPPERRPPGGPDADRPLSDG